MAQMTRCKYHHLDIVSFCLNVGCLLPLCPQCLPQHQSYHFQTATQMCIVSLLQSIEAAQQQLTSMLLPLIKLKQSFHDIRARKLETFYERIQGEKAILMKRMEEQFDRMVGEYVEGMEQGLVLMRERLDGVIGEIEGSWRGLGSGSRSVESLVEFWVNKRGLGEKVKGIEREVGVGSGKGGIGMGMSGDSLNTTIMRNIEVEMERGVMSTKDLFKDVPTATGEFTNSYGNNNNYNSSVGGIISPNNLNSTQNYITFFNQNHSHTPSHNQSYYVEEESEIDHQIQSNKASSRISVLQEENKRILRELGEKRISR